MIPNYLRVLHGKECLQIMIEVDVYPSERFDDGDVRKRATLDVSRARRTVKPPFSAISK